MVDIIREITREQLRGDIPEFRPGDTVRAMVKVVEGTRERIQVFEGVVIRRRAGGINENFTVRRIASHGIGVERTFLLHSPRIDRLEGVRRGKVRRAKLYSLRGRTGRAARIKERRIFPGRKGGVAPAAAAPVTPQVEETTPEVEATAAEE